MLRNVLIPIYLFIAIFAIVSCQPESDSVDAEPYADIDRDILAQILMLEDQRNPDMETFGPLLTDDNPSVRARACLALGRIGNLAAADPFREDVEEILASDEDPGVRAMAAFALGEAEEHDSVAALTEAISDDDSEVRAYASEALGKVGETDDAETLVPLITDDPAIEVREVTLLSSWRLNSERTAEAAFNLLKEGSMQLKKSAAFHLSRNTASSSMPWDAEVFRRMTADSDPEMRKYAARLIVHMDDPEVSGPVIRNLLADDEIPVKVNAWRTASRVGFPVAAKTMMDTLNMKNAHMQLTVLQSVGPVLQNISANSAELFESYQPVIERITEFVDTPDGAIAAAAVQALSFDFEGNPLPSMLSELLADERIPVRTYALAFAAASGYSDFDGVLASALQDSSSQVRMAAVNILRNRNDEKTQARFIDLLNDDDPVIVSVAASRFQQGPVRDALDPLINAYERFKEDSNIEAVQGILQALAAYPSFEKARNALKDALENSPSRVVREHAAASLVSQMGPEVFEHVGPAEATKELDFYRNAVDTVRKYPGLKVTTTRGSFSYRFKTEQATLTANNVISLARKNYFDGITIHRVIPDFVAQMGCPRGDGWGGPGYDIRCEINTLRYERGAVGMALSGKDTGGSQWFITLSPQHHLDGGYTIFATMTEGMEVADSLLPGDKIISVELVEETE